MSTEEIVRGVLGAVVALLVWLQAREGRKQAEAAATRAEAATRSAEAAEGKVDRLLTIVQQVENRLQQVQSQNVDVHVHVPAYPVQTPTYEAVSGTPSTPLRVEGGETTSAPPPLQSAGGQVERSPGEGAR